MRNKLLHHADLSLRGVPTHIIPVDDGYTQARVLDALLGADPNALYATFEEKRRRELWVFITTADPETEIGWDEYNGEPILLGEYVTRYVPSDAEVVRALRGPAGPVGPAGMPGEPGKGECNCCKETTDE